MLMNFGEVQLSNSGEFIGSVAMERLPGLSSDSDTGSGSRTGLGFGGPGPSSSSGGPGSVTFLALLSGSDLHPGSRMVPALVVLLLLLLFRLWWSWTSCPGSSGLGPVLSQHLGLSDSHTESLPADVR